MQLTDFIRDNFIDPLPHIPGDLKLPFVGLTTDFLARPLEVLNEEESKYGPIFKARLLGENVVAVADAGASHEILADKEHIYSSRKGWDFVMGELFKNGLLLRDGKDHRFHRQMLQQAFLKEPMKGYLEIMRPGVEEYIKEGHFEKPDNHVFPRIKELTLKIAGEVFFGVSLDHNLGSINKAISDIVHAVAGLVRLPIPFTQYGQGFVARAELTRYFKKFIPMRRIEPTPDLFGQLCVAELEGTRLTEAEIINHAIFVLMAAHDTTASSITSLIYQLGIHTDWQDKLRAEAREFYEKGNIDYSRLKELELTGWAFKETLRLHPPLVVYPRKLEQDTTLCGYHLKKDTRVAVVSHLLQRSPKYWSNPNAFDPMRFGPDREEHKKHPGAFVPFGSGKHLCLGLNFAEMQAKLIMSKILLNYQWKVPADYKIKFIVPLQEPVDGLPLKFERLPVANSVLV